jgi:hypothetical protein
LEFSGTADSFFDARIAPEGTNGIADVTWKFVSFDLRWEGEDGSSSGIVLRGQGDVEVG